MASPDPADLRRRLRRLEKLARLLETRWRLPVVRVPVGLDAVIGLVPGAGDLVSALISAGIVIEGARLGVRRGTVLRMAGNIGLDFAIGLVPIIGDYADVLFRANTRNLALIRRDLARSHPALGED